METVNKFIQIALIFDQKAFYQENACDSSMHRPCSYRRPQATSRVISELNPLGIFVRGVFLTVRTVVRSIFKNNKTSKPLQTSLRSCSSWIPHLQSTNIYQYYCTTLFKYFILTFYYSHSTRLLAATTLRNVLGTKNLAEILSERETISQVMQNALDEATDPWGVKVIRNDHITL